MTRAERFKQQAERRTTLLLKRISILGNISSPFHYEYTEEQIDKIFKTVRNELDATEKQFRRELKVMNKKPFSLK